MSENQVPGWKELLGKQHAAQLALLCVGVWLHAADSLMVSTIMPDIIADIGGARFIAWTFALYEIGSIIAGAACALLSLRYGLRTTMTSAALLYMTGCLISAIAPEMIILLVGRVLQGLGGGGLVALSLVAANRLFSRALLPRAMAAISMIWGISAFSGPLVGGIFSEFELWRGSFLFFAIQALALAIMILFVLRNEIKQALGHSSGNIPVLRLCLLSSGIISIASAGINVSLVWSPICIILGLGMVSLFLYRDGKSDTNRLLPHHPFSLRHGVGAALTMVFCFTVSSIAFSIYGPLLMVTIYGSSALEAGIILALSSIGWTVFAIAASGSAEKNDTKFIGIGMCVLSFSIIGFMIAIPHGFLSLIACFAFLEGAGFGMAWTFILRRLTVIAGHDEKDRVASALPTVQRAGYAFGAAYLGIVANAVGFGDTVDAETARSVGFWLFAMVLPIAGMGLYAAWIFIRSPVTGGNFRNAD
ncbi:MAG: MFS transporter [Rhodospirillales bacterium]|nr:MFS transporter [Rhodospirillales bacterium]